MPKHLTQADVDEMRRLSEDEGVTQPELAERFETTQENVSQILAGKTWKKGFTPKPKVAFRTPDLYFAAYLKTAGAELVALEREERRGIFVFQVQQTTLAKLKWRWLNGGEVSAATYAAEVKHLKAMLFQA